MKPWCSLLIHEHRLMEEMIGLMKEEVQCIGQTGGVDLAFIDAAVDYVGNYAGRLHHGKEDILFHELSRKKISDEDFMMISGLLEEHQAGGKIMEELLKAKDRYAKGDKSLLPAIIDGLNAFVTSYSQHIQKEETVFFPRSESYFDENELHTLSRKFLDFNEAMICRTLNPLNGKADSSGNMEKQSPH